MLSAHPSPHWPHHTHAHTHPHTHPHTHTHTQGSCWPYSSFHVKETSFSVLFWDMSGSVLKTFSQLQSVPFNGSVNSDSLRPYCLQHIRLHCPSPTPRACLKFKPIKRVMPSNHLILCRPLLLWPSIFPCLRVFSNESVFVSDGQSIRVSALPLPMNIQDWFPLALTALISLQSKGLSRVFPKTTVQNHQFFSAQLSLWSSSPMHTWWLLGKLSFDIWTFVGKVMSLPFNTLSRWIIVFFQGVSVFPFHGSSHHLQWFWSASK